jgi:hypothetical protein
LLGAVAGALYTRFRELCCELVPLGRLLSLP